MSSPPTSDDIVQQRSVELSKAREQLGLVTQPIRTCRLFAAAVSKFMHETAWAFAVSKPLLLFGYPFFALFVATRIYMSELYEPPACVQIADTGGPLYKLELALCVRSHAAAKSQPRASTHVLRTGRDCSYLERSLCAVATHQRSFSSYVDRKLSLTCRFSQTRMEVQRHAKQQSRMTAARTRTSMRSHSLLYGACVFLHARGIKAQIR
eukprot:6200240-Pleurochrysis_carterae.AAC.1